MGAVPGVVLALLQRQRERTEHTGAFRQHAGGHLRRLARDGNGAPAENLSAGPLEAGAAAGRAPSLAVRHQQMQLPVETPAITEGLGG